MIVYCQQNGRFTEMPDKQAIVMIHRGDAIQVSCDAELSYLWAYYMYAKAFNLKLVNGKFTPK